MKDKVIFSSFFGVNNLRDFLKWGMCHRPCFVVNVYVMCSLKGESEMWYHLILECKQFQGVCGEYYVNLTQF